MDVRALVIRTLALLWAVQIFWISTQGFSSDVSSSLLARAFSLMHISVSGNVFWILHTALRKLAHVVEYATLSFLVYRSFDGQDRLTWQPHLAYWSAAAAGAYSLTDEFHQMFVRGRGASLIDCGIDAIGAVIAMLLIYGNTRAFEARDRVSTAR